MITLGIDRGREEEPSLCIIENGKILYLGRDFSEVRKYGFDAVIVDEPITREEVMELINENDTTTGSSRPDSEVT